jgi:hypothetical protein
MKPDLRFLIFMNSALLVIAIYAVLRFLTLTAPQSDFGSQIERLKGSSSIEQAVESADMIAKVANRRGERIKTERKMTEILGAFSAFVCGLNLYFLIWFYRKTKKGIYLQNEIEIQKI